MTPDNLHNKALRITWNAFGVMTESGGGPVIIQTAGSVKLNREIEAISANQGTPLIAESDGGKITVRVKGS